MMPITKLPSLLLRRNEDEFREIPTGEIHSSKGVISESADDGEHGPSSTTVISDDSVSGTFSYANVGDNAKVAIVAESAPWTWKRYKLDGETEPAKMPAVLYTNGAMNPPHRLHGLVGCAAKVALEHRETEHPEKDNFVPDGVVFTETPISYVVSKMRPLFRSEHRMEGFNLLAENTACGVRRHGETQPAAVVDPDAGAVELAGRGSNVANHHRAVWEKLVSGNEIGGISPDWVPIETGGADALDENYDYLKDERPQILTIRVTDKCIKDLKVPNGFSGDLEKLKMKMCIDYYAQKLRIMDYNRLNEKGNSEEEAAKNWGPWLLIILDVTSASAQETLKNVSSTSVHKFFNADTPSQLRDNREIGNEFPAFDDDETTTKYKKEMLTDMLGKEYANYLLEERSKAWDEGKRTNNWMKAWGMLFDVETMLTWYKRWVFESGDEGEGLKHCKDKIAANISMKCFEDLHDAANKIKKAKGSVDLGFHIGRKVPYTI